jgi:hypothetical protein
MIFVDYGITYSYGGHTILYLKHGQFSTSRSIVQIGGTSYSYDRLCH